MSKEQELYKKIYSIDSKYGYHDWSSNKRKNEVSFITDVLKPNSVLDVGCGTNDLCKVLKTKGINNCIGVDFACTKADIISNASDMPFENNTYDLITCFDVLEHIPADQIEKCLQEFARIGKSIMAKIALFSDVHPTGNELHVCLRSPDMWHAVFSKYYNIEHFLAKKSTSTKLQMKYFNKFNGYHVSHIMISGNVRGKL